MQQQVTIIKKADAEVICDMMGKFRPIVKGVSARFTLIHLGFYFYTPE